MNCSLSHKQIPNIDIYYIAILAIVAVSTLPLTPDMLYLDTQSMLHCFYTFYNELSINNSIQLWDPYYYMGTPTDFRNLITMSPQLYFSALLGKCFGIMDSFLLLKIGIMFEIMTYVTGMMLFCSRLFKNRLSILFVGFSVATGSIWFVHLWNNFRLYACLPWVFLFFVLFFEKQKPSYLWGGFIMLLLSLLGSLGYMIAPLSFLVIIFFLVCLYQYRDLLSDLVGVNRWISSSSIISFTVLVGLAGIFYVFFKAHLQDIVLSTYDGRDPATGKVTFNVYLTALTDPTKALQSYWELVYAIPRDWIITCYSGLLVLVCAVYALFKHRQIQSKEMYGILATLLACCLLTLSALTILAPALYFLFPMMDKTRYLLTHIAGLKFFLVILSGFGFDQLATMVLTRTRSDDYQYTGFAWFGLFASCVLVGFDVFWFLGGPLYKGQIIPYEFHFLPLSLLLTVSILTISRNISPLRIPALIILFSIIDLSSYNFMFQFQLSRNRDSGLEKALGVYELTTEAAYRIKVKSLYNFFVVRGYSYQPYRMSYDSFSSSDNLQWNILNYYKFIYIDCMNATYVDTFNSPYFATYFHKGQFRLQQAALGIDIDATMHKTHWMLHRIREGERFVGATRRPKAFITDGVYLAKNIADAAEYIHEYYDADLRPALLTGDKVFFDIPEQEKSIQPDVKACADGKCTDAPLDDASFWNSFSKKHSNRHMQILLTYQNPKEVTFYKFTADGKIEPQLMPISWRLRGSNDGVNWEDLDKQSREHGWKFNEQRGYHLPKPSKYRHYLFEIDETDPTGHFSFASLSLRKFSDHEFPQSTWAEVPVHEFTANSIKMSCTISPGNDQWLVYLDNADRGWNAWVDGEVTPVNVANLAFKAVRLSPGTHEVVFKYFGKEFNGVIQHFFVTVGALFSLWLISQFASLAFPMCFRSRFYCARS